MAKYFRTGEFRVPELNEPFEVPTGSGAGRQDGSWQMPVWILREYPDQADLVVREPAEPDVEGLPE